VEVQLEYNTLPLPDAPGQPPLPQEVKNLSPIHTNGGETFLTPLIPKIPAKSSNYLRFTVRFTSIPLNPLLEGLTLMPITLASGEPLVKVVANNSQPSGGQTASARLRGANSTNGGLPPPYSLSPAEDAVIGCVSGLSTNAAFCALGFVPGTHCVTQVLSAIGGIVQAATDVASGSGTGLSSIFDAFQIQSAFLLAATCTGSSLPIFAAISCAVNLGSAAYDCYRKWPGLNVKAVHSSDPNEKIGAQGLTDQHYISGSDPLRYAIYFENKPDASAPAQTVVITDQLDVSKFDLSTFSLGLIGFGDATVVNPPFGLKTFKTDVDLRPAQNLIVRINAALNSSTGVVTWQFQSIDPSTGLPTTDPLAGFLPPNQNGTQGEGSVLFTVMPKADLATGTQITNASRVTFDLNAPLDTNTYLNTIDNTNPVSHVNALDAAQPFVIFNVSWSGTDTGPGIRVYTVYVSDSGGPYSIWLLHTTQTSAFFIGQGQKTYSFFTVATDQANNQEAIKSTAEASTSTPTNIANAIDDARFFVRQHYLDFLSREPDQGGWDYWTGQITQCVSDPTCLHNKRVDVSNSFFFELEYQQTGSYVFRLYRAAYGNNQPFPNGDTSNQTEAKKLPSFAVFAPDRVQVVGGSNLAQSQLDLANAFVQRAEFLAKYPASLDGPSFISALLDTIKTDTGVDLSSQSSALLSLFTQAGGGTAGRGTVMHRLADDNAQSNPLNNRPFIDAEYNRSFVYGEYAGYLRRDSDIGGFLFWLGQVNSGPLGDTTKQHAMVCSFITSAEYQMRFGSVVTHSNSECPH
jgi:hypothetical protein